MLNTMIALFVEMFPDKMSDAMGKELALKISTATLPADYDSAARQVRKFLDDIEQGK